MVLTDAEHLPKAGIRVLVVPRSDYLSPEEIAAVEAFEAAGGRAYERAVRRGASRGVGLRGYTRFCASQPLYQQLMQAEDLAAEEGLTPAFTLNCRGAEMQTLLGEGFALLSLVNLTCPHRPVSPVITLPANVGKTTLYRVGFPAEVLPVENGVVKLPPLTDGAMVLAEIH